MTSKQLPIRFEGVPKSFFSLDWLTFTVHGDETVMKRVLKMFDVAEWDIGNGGRGFKSSLVGLDNLRVYVNPVNGGEYFSVDLPGRALERVGVLKVFEVLRSLDQFQYRWNTTRVDLAFDTRQFTTTRVWHAVERGAFTCNVHRENVRQFHSVDGQSDTIYFGSSKSLALLRIYRKTDDEFNPVMGSEPFTRVELQLRKERSDHAVRLLLYEKSEMWAERAASVLLGFIRFEGGWWEKWLGTVKAVWAKVKQVKPTVRKIEQWLHVQVVASLATYLDAMAKVRPVDEVIEELVALGREKYKSRHRAAIRLFEEGDMALFACPDGEYRRVSVGGATFYRKSVEKKQVRRDGIEEVMALFRGAAEGEVFT